MLILTRKIGEKILIDANIEVVIIESTSKGVKLGINAPENVNIYREELYLEIKAENAKSKEASLSDINNLAMLLNENRDKNGKNNKKNK